MAGDNEQYQNTQEQAQEKYEGQNQQEQQMNGQEAQENEEAAEEQADVVELSREEYEELKQKAADNDSVIKRVKADFENYKKSVEKEKDDYKQYAMANMIEKLLPVLDTFDQALSSAMSEEEKKGLGLVYSQLIDILEKEGLQPIESVGNTFDPYKHEILMQGDSDQEDDTILEEFQKGYMFKGRIMRYSKVKVAKKRDKDGENSGSGDYE